MSRGSCVSFSYRLITLRSVFRLQTTWPHPYISRLLPYVTSPLPNPPLRAGPEQKMPEGTRLRQINTQPPSSGCTFQQPWPSHQALGKATGKARFLSPLACSLAFWMQRQMLHLLYSSSSHLSFWGTRQWAPTAAVSPSGRGGSDVSVFLARLPRGAVTSVKSRVMMAACTYGGSLYIRFCSYFTQEMSGTSRLTTSPSGVTSLHPPSAVSWSVQAGSVAFLCQIP